MRPVGEMAAAGYSDYYISYRSPHFSARETTILPGQQVTLTDAGAYGLILLQGHGTIGVHAAETPPLIRFGQMTRAEFFVTAAAARAGVTVTNPSDCDPLVMLRHYGPGNVELA